MGIVIEFTPSLPIVISLAGAVAGAIGAATGILALWINFLTYLRDSVHVRVRLVRNFKVFNGSQEADDAVREMLANYEAQGQPPPLAVYLRDPDKVWASIDVTNAGRRTVTLIKIAWGSQGRESVHSPLWIYGS